MVQVEGTIVSVAKRRKVTFPSCFSPKYPDIQKISTNSYTTSILLSQNQFLFLASLLIRGNWTFTQYLLSSIFDHSSPPSVLASVGIACVILPTIARNYIIIFAKRWRQFFSFFNLLWHYFWTKLRDLNENAENKFTIYEWPKMKCYPPVVENQLLRV